MILAPYQSVVVRDVISALNAGIGVCHLISQPGTGLSTCFEYVRSQIITSAVMVKDHVGLAGLDLLGQFYEELHIDLEFQEKAGVPALVTELCAMKGNPTIFIHDFEQFALAPGTREKSLKQLGWLLNALPNSGFVIVSSPDYQAEIYALCQELKHTHKTFELGSFADKDEFKSFFERLIDQRLGLEGAADKELLDDLYQKRKGNLAWTMLELFHPGCRGQRESSHK